MKAASSFRNAVSAAAFSAALVVPTTLAGQFVFVSAAQAAVIRSIDVQGNQRVDDATVRSYIGIEPGKNFSNADIDEAVKRLFATGMFSDVRINQVGSTLVVQVDEHSVVNQVLFQGNRKIKDAQLASTVQLKPRSAFSNAAMEADAEAIRQAYASVGRDDATVRTQVMDLGQGRVNVVYEITEGGRTKIARLDFVGNNSFSKRRLADVIATKKSSVLSVLLRDDIYDENRLRADEEALRRFYYNRGYADFQVVSSTANLDEATNSYSITITVDEGARYTFGDVSIESTIEGVNSDSLRSLLQTRSGQVYSAKEVEDTIIALTEHVAGLGYAFAQVTPRGDRNFENHTISVVYTVDQGPRTYIERIEIRGNARSRDFVIRREFDVSEGDAFNQVLIQRAKRRLERLGFFETVEVSTAPGSEADQVILVIDVTEKSTGEFSVGAGYSTGGETAGPQVEGSITERNFLGRGQFIRFSAGGGENSRDFALSFTEPYFLGRRIAAGFDIFRSNRQYSNYESTTTGGTIRFGLPITETISTQLFYTLQQEEYDLDDNCLLVDGVIVDQSACNVSIAIVNGVENSPWITSSIGNTLLYNNIDDMKNPHAGLYGSLTTAYAGLGGDAEWVKVTTRATYYHTLSEEYDVVALLTGGAGYIAGTSDGQLRVFDQFKNNDRMIRGFEYNGIGPFDPSTGEHLGGTTYFNASAEAQFPMPFLPENFGLKGAVFADAATLYGNEIELTGLTVAGTEMQWRASVGVGLIWASPFGPLRVDYAVPVLKEDTDEEQNFNFGISTRF